MYFVTNELIGSDMENKIEDKSNWADSPIITNNNQNIIGINHVRAIFLRKKQSISCHVAKRNVDKKI